MVEDSKSSDDQDTCGIDRDSEEETEHAKGSLRGNLGAKEEKEEREEEKMRKPNSGGTQSDTATDSQDVKP